MTPPPSTWWCDTEARARAIRHAGAVFIGPWTAQVAGDYALGSNHTLPTAGVARVRGGLHAADFVKLVSTQRATRAGLRALAGTSPHWRVPRASRATRARSRSACAGPLQFPPPAGGTKGSCPMTTIQGMPDLGPGLRLHLNENTGGCSPAVLAAIRGVSMADVATYADYEGAVRRDGRVPRRRSRLAGADQRPRRGAAADGHRLPDAAGPRGAGRAGAPPMALSGQPEQILMLPTFEPYVINAKALGARTVAIPCGPDFAFPVEAVLSAMTPNTRLDLHQHPATIRAAAGSEAVIRRVVGRAGHAVVLVDEAYHDFQGETSSPGAEVPNAILGRTFSKAYGLAGMRVGVHRRPRCSTPIRS